MNDVRTTPRAASRSGFTLAEFLVAFAAASVLVLTIGAMLWYAFLGYRRTGEAVNLQRDMRVTMETLTRMTRSATNISYSTGSVFTARFSDRPPATVYAVNSNLFYDPNTSAGGDIVQLVQNRLRTFNVAVATNAATVTLALATPFDVISNRVVLTQRN